MGKRQGQSRLYLVRLVALTSTCYQFNAIVSIVAQMKDIGEIVRTLSIVNVNVNPFALTVTFNLTANTGDVFVVDSHANVRLTVIARYIFAVERDLHAIISAGVSVNTHSC